MYRLLPLMAQASTAVFAPTDLSGLVAWYDFSDITTLFTDSARTTAVTADGDPIGGVTDKSGQANHLAQGTASRRPTFKTGIQNGKSIVRFDGTDDLMDLANSISGASCSVAWVAQGDTAKDTMFVLSWGGNVRGFYGRYTGDEVGWRDNTYAFRHTNILFTSGMHVLEYQMAVPNGKLWKDGVESNTLSYSAGTLSAMTFGGAGTGAWAIKGDVCELLVYSPKLTDANHSTLRNYLNSKWMVY